MRALIAVALLAAVPAAAQDHASHCCGEGAHADAMPGLLGPYAMSREASGTAWQPEAAPMDGVHASGAGFTWMLHGYADVIYNDQGGPRGDEKAYVPSMLMAMGRRPAGDGALGVRAMVSLDPLMGRAGYPLLFQTGETADGVTHLVDRQHPHDFFMELAGTYSHPVRDGSVFVYAGLPGEPALGPATFMHRASGMVIPEAPLSHHWLDATHISFGVLTLGATGARWKLDASVFNGREPDHNRWNIETDALDSYAARITINATPSWSMQASHGYLVAPEQLEPDVNVHRTTASLSYHAAVDNGSWSGTAAWGLNRANDHGDPAGLLEIVRRIECTALFTRLEWVENDHLFEDTDPLAGQHDIGKISVGLLQENLAARDWWGFSAGALVSAYAVPNALDATYGDDPISAMVFIRASIR